MKVLGVQIVTRRFGVGLYSNNDGPTPLRSRLQNDKPLREKQMKPRAIWAMALSIVIGLNVQLATAQDNEAHNLGKSKIGNSAVTFVVHGYENVDPAMDFGPLKAEFEKRGFACMIVRSPRTATKTPHQDRANAVISALRDVKGDIALLGVSNQGLFLPLVAAARPVRRIVFVNALIPRPGKSYAEVFKTEQVFTTPQLLEYALKFPGMSEVCPLKELPKCEYVYISAENDEAVRPDWQQWAARTFLHVEPTVIKGASHGRILLTNTQEVVDAAAKGLE